MLISLKGRRWGTAAAGLLLCFLMQASHGTDTPRITDAGAFLDRTEELRIKDHRQFAQRLAQIHRQSPALTPAERWHLRYLDALESSLEGQFAAAEKPLHEVIDQSGDPKLVIKASALLMNNLAVTHRYEEAFQLAQQLTLDLPNIRDDTIRIQVLSYLSQILNLAGQTDLAIKYAHMMEGIDPSVTTACYAHSKQVAALYNAKRLTSSSQELKRVIGMCETAGQPIMTMAAQLILGTLFLEEHQPAKALALLDRIATGIRINHYYPHTLSAQVQRSQAYEQLGRDEDARKAALAALAMAAPDDINDYLMEAYGVLYRIAKRHGNSASALVYYEHYVTQSRRSLDDAAAQALAYQTAQQRVLTRKLETEELSKQNSVLKLQQALNAKAAEASRLYITLLVILLAAIALWLFRSLRSQKRFKYMATRDGLTGILNHQHFVSEVDRVLRPLERKPSHACLISIDLDHFKEVNDTHGHAAGDAVLKHAVAICQQHLRPADLFGRLGGEEFGILLHECSRSQGLEIADRIRTAIAEATIDMNGRTVSISASVGLACTDTWGYELQRLCMEADAALYRAKRAGRNRVVAASDRSAGNTPGAGP